MTSFLVFELDHPRGSPIVSSSDRSVLVDQPQTQLRLATNQRFPNKQEALDWVSDRLVGEFVILETIKP